MSEILAGRYELGDLIGRGGMAQVYRATDATLGRTVAVKVLSSQFASDPSFVERFRREAQAAAKLNNPNVVNVYDSGTEGSTHYIVMEYVEGRTLAQILQQDGRLLPERASEVTESVCDALAFTHAAGIVHRDVKPGNIMVTNQGQVKLMDFGIARADSQETAAQTAAVLGTAAYLSPEQAQGAPLDSRSDIYSLGIVLYETLTGRPPFQGDTAVAVAMQHVNDQPVPPSQLVNGITPDLDAVAMRALSKNPDNRYLDVGEFKADLERVRAGQAVAAPPIMAASTQVLSPTQATSPTDDDGSDNTKKWLWILGIAIAIGLLILIWILFFSGNGTPGPDDSPSPGQTTVAVPSLEGLTRAEAETQLTEAGLDFEKVSELTDDPNEVGTVLKQDPAAGEEVAKGTVVTLTIGKSAASPTPGTTSVPSVFNLTQQEASSDIAAAGLVVSVTKGPSNDVAKGSVYKQSPSAGQEVDEQSTVKIWVSTGPPEPEKVAVPQLECEKIGKAQNKLTKAGLVPQVSGSPDPNPSCPSSNEVGSMDPAGGTLVAPGSTVTLYPSGP